jgi:hypothetical protein
MKCFFHCNQETESQEANLTKSAKCMGIKILTGNRKTHIGSGEPNCHYEFSKLSSFALRVLICPFTAQHFQYIIQYNKSANTVNTRVEYISISETLILTNSLKCERPIS